MWAVDTLLSIGMLNLGPRGHRGGSVDLLPDCLPNPLVHAELVAVPPGVRAHEFDVTGVASLRSGESDLGGSSLDALNVLVLGLTKAGKVRN